MIFRSNAAGVQATEVELIEEAPQPLAVPAFSLAVAAVSIRKSSLFVVVIQEEPIWPISIQVAIEINFPN